MANTKGKARPSAATLEQAKEKDFDSSHSYTYYTTINPMCQSGSVSSVLQHGEQGAIPGKVLVAMLKLKNQRELTRIIEHERKSGIPICASVSGEDRGYFIADGPEALEAYIKSLDRRLKNIRLQSRNYR